jgi:hypothetical protein
MNRTESPATTSPTAVKVPTTAGVLCKKPAELPAPAAVSDDKGLSSGAGSPFVGLGLLAGAVNVAGTVRSVGTTLRVVCVEVSGINNTEGVETEDVDTLVELELEAELLGGVKEVKVDEVVGSGVKEIILWVCVEEVVLGVPEVLVVVVDVVGGGCPPSLVCVSVAEGVAETEAIEEGEGWDSVR